MIFIQGAHARILFESEFLFINPIAQPNEFIIDQVDDTSTDVELQFGNSGGSDGLLTWDITNNEFDVASPVNFNQNELREAVIENIGALPGTGDPGEILYLTSDGNPYVWDDVQGTWEDITAISAFASKVISVGTGLDFSNIEAGASYLNTLSGGIMLLAAETHTVTNATDLTNIILIGKDASQTTVQISGSGQLDSFDTRFQDLTLDINAITDDMAIDVQSGTSSLFFTNVEFDILDSGDSLIDSNAGAAPTVTIRIVNSTQTGTSGTMVKAEATGNLDTGSGIYLSSANGNGLLQFEDWDVTLAGATNVLTSGTLTTVPSDTIFVYPGMNLQAAINSVTSGGTIILLPGTHSITSPLLISNDNIEIQGYGDDSVISATGFSSPTDTTAAVQLGAADGTAPVDGITLRDFKVEVTGDEGGGTDIHGVRAAGGMDLLVDNITVQKISGTSGSGATARMGIHFIDGTSQELMRPVIRNTRVLGNGGSNYFTDGIHVTSNAAIPGVFGNSTGITDPLVEGNYVDYVRETAYVYVGTTGGNLNNNRATQMGAGGSGYGIFLGEVTNVVMDANVFSGSLGTTSIAIGVDSFNTGALTETRDSVFTNNIIDGIENGGVGFGTGFQIGNATNVNVQGNAFRNNVIRGASTEAGTVAMVWRGDASQNMISENNIIGGTNAWDTGINLDGTGTQTNNTIRGTLYDNVTAELTDSSTALLRGVDYHQDTVNPTVNDDIDNYKVGSLWINTTSDVVFSLVDNTDGAAVWNFLVGDQFTTSNTFTIDQDDTGGNVTLQFGTSLAETLTWDNTNSEFDLSDDLNITGGLITSANIDLNSNQLLEVRTENLGSAPTCNGANAGRTYFNTSGNHTYVCDGTTWQFVNDAPQVVHVYDGTGGVTITSTEAVLNLDTTAVIDAAYSLASDTITFNNDALYKIYGRFTSQGVDTTGAPTRVNGVLRLESDTGGGFVDVAGAECRDYLREDANQSFSCSFAHIGSFDVGDDVRLTVQLDAGGATTTNNTVSGGSSLTIEMIRPE